MSLPSPAARPPGTAAEAGAAGRADASGTTDTRPAPAAAAGSVPGPDSAADGDTNGAPDDEGDPENPATPHDPATDRCPAPVPVPAPGTTGTAEWDLLTDHVHWSPEIFRLLGCDPGLGPLSLDRLPDRLAEADRPQLRRMMTDALVHGRSPAGLVEVHGLGAVECEGEPVLGTDGTVTALRMRLRAA
ncbi:hypothetical protein ACWGB8_10420 [Kitasatospora sp. NPDC054939]